MAKVGIRNKYDAAQHAQYTKLKRHLDALVGGTADTGTAVIVFSKDRAMQLDALLRSYFFYVKNPVPVKVLFHASDAAYMSAYKDVIELYGNREVEFIQEHDFKQNLIGLVESLTCAKVLFMVDDLVFKDEVDFEKFCSVDTKKYIASLRLGEHLERTYTLDRNQELPKFTEIDDLLHGLSWSWADGDADWAYPLSVDGHLFDREEFAVLVSGLDYRAPNSFEEALLLMKPYFLGRKGLCYHNSVIVNNPCNKVQSENDNISGDISIEELNKKWLDGYRIAFEQFKGLRNKSAHQELQNSFVKR